MTLRNNIIGRMARQGSHCLSEIAWSRLDGIGIRRLGFILSFWRPGLIHLHHHNFQLKALIDLEGGGKPQGELH